VNQICVFFLLLVRKEKQKWLEAQEMFKVIAAGLSGNFAKNDK